MTIRIDFPPFDATPAGRVVIHNFARRAILDALAPSDRLLDVGCGGGLLLRDNSYEPAQDPTDAPDNCSVTQPRRAWRVAAAIVLAT
jgi:hypothetical protein